MRKEKYRINAHENIYLERYLEYMHEDKNAENDEETVENTGTIKNVNLIERIKDTNKGNKKKNAKQEQMNPAVLILPGGGFLKHSEHEAEPVANEFSRRGFQPFVLYYTVQSKHKSHRSDTATDICVVEQAVEDLCDAFSVMHEHSDEWGIDIKKIIVIGFSAGAYLAALYQVKYSSRLSGEHIQGKCHSITPAGMILSYGVFDLAVMEQSRLEKQEKGEDASLLTMINQAMFGCTALSGQLIERMSPVNYVSEKLPPVFLWATDNDELVPAMNSLRMAQEFAKHHVPYEMHIYHDGVHGMALATEGNTARAEEINPHCAAWIDAAFSWIRDRVLTDE